MRSAAPEEIARRGRDHGEIRCKRGDPVADLIAGQAIELPVDEEDLVSLRFEHLAAIAAHDEPS
jgi:hypothetical protein